MWSETAAIASVPDRGSPLARAASIATIWHASAAFMSITPWPYTAPSISAPEKGSVTLHPCDTGLVSMCPVRTTVGPSPKETCPTALGRSSITGCRSTPSNPASRIVEARKAASGPSSPRTLGIRHTSWTRATARSRSSASSTLAAAAVGTVPRSIVGSLASRGTWVSRRTACSRWSRARSHPACW